MELFVFSNITILPKYLIDKNSLEKSYELLYNVDLKDISYVALAMQLDLTLITRDKILQVGLKKQGFKKVLLFEEFLENI